MANPNLSSSILAYYTTRIRWRFTAISKTSNLDSCSCLEAEQLYIVPQLVPATLHSRAIRQKGSSWNTSTRSMIIARILDPLAYGDLPGKPAGFQRTFNEYSQTTQRECTYEGKSNKNREYVHPYETPEIEDICRKLSFASGARHIGNEIHSLSRIMPCNPPHD